MSITSSKTDIVSHHQKIIYRVLVSLTKSMIFFFNDTATTEIYTLSLHDALPIWRRRAGRTRGPRGPARAAGRWTVRRRDRKSTRLNSSHGYISYAVFCLKKKNTNDRYAANRSAR